MAEYSEKTLFFTEGPVQYNKNWRSLRDTEEDSIKYLIELLSSSKMGKMVIKEANQKARNLGQTLWDVIKVGNNSITDTTLIRKFSPSNPNSVAYESRSIVYLNKDLSTFNAILDLAHELTHFTKREAFNPYRVNFSLKDFIKSTVEGKGGEVEAYLTECQVLLEMFPKNIWNNSKCEKVYDQKSKQFSMNLGILEFYRIGEYFEEFKKLEKLGILTPEEFPYLNDKGPIFISSAWGLPYPVAAIKEFKTILKKVCRNDRKRLDLMKDELKRGPASNSSNSYKEYLDLNSRFETKCQSS